MKIAINDHRKIFAIQKEFTEKFPFLKIEFFVKPPKPGAASPEKLVRRVSKTIGDCRSIHPEGTITIKPEMTVADLVQTFGDVYGLTVQILRKSGNVWLVISVTRDWTLEKQNNQGEELSAEERGRQRGKLREKYIHG